MTQKSPGHARKVPSARRLVRAPSVVLTGDTASAGGRDQGGRDALSASLPKAQGPGGGSGLTERGHHNAPGGLQTLTVEETVVEGMGFGGRGVDDTVRDRKTHLRGW